VNFVLMVVRYVAVQDMLLWCQKCVSRY